MSVLETVGWPFSTFHHLNIIVDDMEATEQFLDSIGIRLHDYPPRGEFLEIKGVDEDTIGELGFKRALIGNIHLQFMSPGKRDSVHKRIAEEFGKRAYSIGFVVRDVDTAEQELLKRGLKILTKVRRKDGAGTTYFDTFDKLGVNLVIRQSSLDHSNGP